MAKRGIALHAFRPFNPDKCGWIVSNAARIGSSRAITQLISEPVEGTPIVPIDGGRQKRVSPIFAMIEAIYSALL